MPKIKVDLVAMFPEYKIMTVIENFDCKQLMYGVTMSKQQKIKSIEIRDDKIVSIDEFETVR